MRPFSERCPVDSKHSRHNKCRSVHTMFNKLFLLASAALAPTCVAVDLGWISPAPSLSFNFQAQRPFHSSPVHSRSTRPYRTARTHSTVRAPVRVPPNFVARAACPAMHLLSDFVLVDHRHCCRAHRADGASLHSRQAGNPRWCHLSQDLRRELSSRYQAMGAVRAQRSAPAASQSWRGRGCNSTTRHLALALPRPAPCSCRSM